AKAPCPPWIEGDWSPASGYAAGRRLARNPDVTAVFAANDDMAIGVMSALAEAGRRVPDDVSVIGLDDIPIAAYQTPPLTTVRQDFVALVRNGLERLVGQIEAPGDDRPGSDSLEPVSLVVRRSTRAPVHR
ncbi:substrate-binding domain-containing protein, partial [Actinoplanes sp. NPDC051633]|uniref:substrate-binding domain-containing protein n=1 Tax=Actinoplanes sp. NPDC051633 TaxID=3155670 RepID=UPI00342689B4